MKGRKGKENGSGGGSLGRVEVGMGRMEVEERRGDIKEGGRKRGKKGVWDNDKM